jgi:hypothetical protein
VSWRAYSVHFVPADEKIAEVLLEEARTFFPFSRAFRYDLRRGEISIYVADSMESFRRLTRGVIPHWGTACAFPREGTIVLKSPRIAEVWREDVTVVLRHELMHVYVYRIARGSAPRWFDEGMATYFSGEWDLRKNFDMATAVLGGHLIPLEDMEVSYPTEEERVNLFYLESHSAVAYLVSQLGMDGFMSFLHRLLTTGSFEGALYAQTGMTTDVFEQRWEKWLSRSYNPIYLLGRTEVLFFLFMVVLLVAYVARRRRYRDLLKQMDREEQEIEDPPGPPGWFT